MMPPSTLRIAAFLLPLALLLTAGCGGDLPEMIPAEGMVTFNGGPPPAPGSVALQPIEPVPGYSYRPASGRFNETGRFVITSWEPGDGVGPGKYRVQLECWKSPPNEATGSAGVSHIPAGFNLPDLEVPPNSPKLQLKFEVPAH